MKIQYSEGPDSVKMGEYLFRRGEPHEIQDDIAEGILKKQSVKFTSVDEEKTSPVRTARSGKKEE